MQEDQYLSISEESRGLYKEKGSRFIAIALPLDSPDEAKELLEKIRKEYHDARHHCYAYKVGRDRPEFRHNDDGEPSGTAGKPIYGQIESFGMTNILIVVVRYFGGIKLGTGGLIQAYRAAARDALENALPVTKTIMTRFSLHFSYIILNDVMRIVKEEELKILSQDFSTDGKMVLEARMGRIEAIHDRFSSLRTVEFKAVD
jgi:uncharacterized YigZ family protein